MNSSKAQTYIQKTIAGRPNGTEIIAGTTTTNCWKQHTTICKLGAPPVTLTWHSKGYNQGKQTDCDQCARFADEMQYNKASTARFARGYAAFRAESLWLSDKRATLLTATPPEAKPLLLI